MKMEMKDELSVTVDRLAAAAGLLEQAVERLAQRQNDFAQDAEASIGRIVATVETRRETELEERLSAAEHRCIAAETSAAAAEQKLSELQARAGASAGTGRKTLPSAMTTLLAKQGVTIDSLEAGALDAALTSLSLEQRIAVKSQLLRAGLLA